MDKQTQLMFIKEIATDFISAEWPIEAEYVDIVFEEMQPFGFTIGNSTDEIPLGLGANDILETLQSPVVVATVATLWTSLIAPTIKEIVVMVASKQVEKPAVSEEVMRRLSKQKIRDYIRTQVQKSSLNREMADRLSDRVVEWLASHPEELEHIAKR